MPSGCRFPDTALGRLMAAGELTWTEVCARSGVSERSLKALARAETMPSGRTRISTLLRVAAALGAAPAEVMPGLAVRPRGGLLYERGVFEAPGRRRGRTRAPASSIGGE